VCLDLERKKRQNETDFIISKIREKAIDATQYCLLLRIAQADTLVNSKNIEMHLQDNLETVKDIMNDVTFRSESNINYN
jgi:hypothetical protein